MAELIKENIYRLPVPLKGNPLKSLNSYLIKGETSLLIDTGFRTEECYKALTFQLAELGVELDKTDIFLTHLHSDHTGLAVDLHKDGRRLFVSKEDGLRMIAYGTDPARIGSEAFFTRNGFPSELLIKLRDKNPAIKNAPPHFEGYTFINDGQCFNYGGYELRAIATPGHTPGHMCLYIQSEQLLFMGDHVLFDITPNITSWSGFPNSLGKYLESLDKIKELPVTTALPGHREIEGNMVGRIEALKAHHARRLNEALDAVTAFPGSPAYRVAGRMSWDIRADSWEEFPPVQRWFAMGEAVAHLDYLCASGKIKEVLDGELVRYYPI